MDAQAQACFNSKHKSSLSSSCIHFCSDLSLTTALSGTLFRRASRGLRYCRGCWVFCDCGVVATAMIVVEGGEALSPQRSSSFFDLNQTVY